jgi:hypothetical protein
MLIQAIKPPNLFIHPSFVRSARSSEVSKMRSKTLETSASANNPGSCFANSPTIVKFADSPPQSVTNLHLNVPAPVSANSQANPRSLPTLSRSTVGPEAFWRRFALREIAP